MVFNVCEAVPSVWLSVSAHYAYGDNASDREAYSHVDNFLNPGSSGRLGPQNNCLSGVRERARGVPQDFDVRVTDSG